MRIFILLLFCIFVSCTKKIAKETIAPKFPDAWLGHWKGNLEIYNAKGKSMSIVMEAVNLRTDTTGVYRWELKYGDQEIRKYLLRLVDKEKGHYMVDERNSIYLDSYVLSNKLISTFEVQKNLLTSVYTIEGDNLIFEIFMSDVSKPNESGNTIMGNDSIPLVSAFPTKVYQKALLKRMER